MKLFPRRNEIEAVKILEKGKTDKILVKTGTDFLGYQGSTPFVEFDENWSQMPLDRTEMTIPREHLMRMMPLAYLAGKLSNLNQAQKTSIFIILMFVFSILTLGYLYIGMGGVNKRLNDISTANAASQSSITNLTNTVNQMNGLLQQINSQQLKNNIQSYNTIPTVGG